jgi:hypothetical protein
VNITSSNFAAAIGLNPYCSRQKLFRQLSGIESRDPPNAFMEWGTLNECNAVAAAEAETGILFRDTGERQKHYTINGGEHEYGTTPDGRYQAIGVEAKCPQSVWDEPPAYYLPQIIGQAKIATFDEVLFACWTPEETRIWRYEFDPKHWLWLYPLLNSFMDDLTAGTQPKRQKKPDPPVITLERI